MQILELTATALHFRQQIFLPQSAAEQIAHTPQIIFGVLECCLAVAFAALWLVARDYRVFRMLGIFYALVGIEQFAQYFNVSDGTWTIRCFAVAVMIETAAQAMQIRRYGWTRLFWPVYLVSLIAGWFPSMQFVRDWPLLFSQIALIVLVAQAFRHGTGRDRIIAAAFLFHFFVRMCISTNLQHLLGIRNYVLLGGWQWQYTTTNITLLAFITLAVFVRDLIRDRDEKQRLAAELAAGRAVQQVLIAKEIPEVRGFQIQAIYKPHGEVGGDFFQVIPLAGNGALIAIGDVSGKGMSAAMMVSLLVGVLHTLAEKTTSPAELLAGLNRRATGRSRGGFTTCLILRLDADGILTTANAGHIAPYLNGAELSVENGLPLGLTAQAVYMEGTTVLRNGDRLALLTDGVVEARAESGELYGFERAASISTEPAEKVAQAAQAFGQEDDITVLTVERLAIV